MIILGINQIPGILGWMHDSAAAIVKGLLPNVSFNVVAFTVGLLMIVYVVYGGMKGTTWVLRYPILIFLLL